MSTPANISAALCHTIAQNISRRLDDDGQCFADRLTGTSLHDMALQHGGFRTYRYGVGTDTYRWNFPDGSAIVVAGAAWDFPLDAAEECFCWEGNGVHTEGCAAA